MVAPMVLDGPINGVWFQAYIEQVLVPELRPGDIVITNDLGSHKGAGLRAALEGKPGSCTFRPTAPTSIQSRTPSPRRRFCERRRSERSTACGAASAHCCRPSRRRNAPTSSPLPAMIKPNPL
jgi:hypothetical protein